MFSNNAVMLSAFSWLAEKLIGGFFSILMTVINVIIEIWIALLSQYLFFIGRSLLKIVDFIQSLARKLVGLDTYWYEGQKIDHELGGQDPVLKLISHPRVQQVFMGMLIVAIVVLIISTLVQILRLEYTTEGAQNTKGKLFGKAIKALAMFLIVPIGTTFGIFVGNQLLISLDRATNPSGSAYISGAIFTAAASEASYIPKLKTQSYYYIAKDDTSNEHTGVIGTPIKDGNGNIITDETGNYRNAEGERLILVQKLSSTGASTEGIMDTIKKFISGTFFYTKAESEDVGGRLVVTFEHEPSKLAQNMGTETVVTKFESNMGNVEEQKNDIANQIDDAFATGKDGLDYMNVAHVAGFYNLAEINYLVLFAAAIMVLYVLFNLIFGLILRLYKVAIYFMVSPPIIALMPINEGAFNSWRTAMVSTVISAYGAVVGLNLFIMMLPILKNIQLFDPYNSLNRGFNAYTYLLIVIAGCYFVKELIGTLSKWIGADDAFAEGDKISKKTVATAGKVAMTALGPAGGAAKLAAGAGKAALSGVAGKGVGTRMSGNRAIRKGQKMLEEADELDKQGRGADGRLLPGHKLKEVVRLRKEGQQRVSEGQAKVAKGKGIIKQRRKAGVANMGEAVKAPVRGMAAGASNFVKAVKAGGMADVSGKIFKGAATAFGVDPKAFDETAKKSAEKKAGQEQDAKIQGATIKNLNIDSVKGDISAMEGGIKSALAALAKPGGKTEALSIAEALKENGAELGSGFELIASSLKNAILDSQDGTGQDVSAQMQTLLSSVQTKGAAHTTNIENIINTGGNEKEIAKLDSTTKKVLKELVDKQKNKNK